MLAGALELVQPFEDQSTAHLTAAPLGHADESGVRGAGCQYWMHVICIRLATSYGIHTRRGRRVMDEFGIRPALTGTLVTNTLATSCGGVSSPVGLRLCRV
ncbi:hypothetical protein GCM10022420_012460 [Streptomyces iranensis]|uniref:Transposase IS66 central domain-containing protein n=1 Tax=Streptomyces iranensis TaxID=576784 RepID=A0A061A2D2_9ACTN|nr:hypothetical protein [Streptomyces iranensis]CDR10113.1 predicted protein [Streptomyces iranensis]